MMELTNIVCVISRLYDGDDSPPADYVRAVAGKFEAVITKINDDDCEEVVLGCFDDSKSAIHAIWKFNHQEQFLNWWDHRTGRMQ